MRYLEPVEVAKPKRKRCKRDEEPSEYESDDDEDT
jgi:hypothetical protein